MSPAFDKSLGSWDPSKWYSFGTRKYLCYSWTWNFGGSKMPPWITNLKGTPLRKSLKIVDFGGFLGFRAPTSPVLGRLWVGFAGTSATLSVLGLWHLLFWDPTSQFWEPDRCSGRWWNLWHFVPHNNSRAHPQTALSRTGILITVFQDIGICTGRSRFGGRSPVPVPHWVY